MVIERYEGSNLELFQKSLYSLGARPRADAASCRHRLDAARPVTQVALLPHDGRGQLSVLHQPVVPVLHQLARAFPHAPGRRVVLGERERDRAQVLPESLVALSVMAVVCVCC